MPPPPHPPPVGGATAKEPGGGGGESHSPDAAPYCRQRYRGIQDGGCSNRPPAPPSPAPTTERPAPRGGGVSPKASLLGKTDQWNRKSTRSRAGHGAANLSSGGGRARKKSSCLSNSASSTLEVSDRVTSVKNNFTKKLRRVVDSPGWPLCR